jgi:hypothetical protein
MIFTTFYDPSPRRLSADFQGPGRRHLLPRQQLQQGRLPCPIATHAEAPRPKGQGEADALPSSLDLGILGQGCSFSLEM